MDELHRRRLRRRIAAFQHDQEVSATSWGCHLLAHRIQVAIDNNQPLTCSKLLDDYNERHPQLVMYRRCDERSSFGPIWLQTEQAIMDGDHAALAEMYRIQRIVRS